MARPSTRTLLRSHAATTYKLTTGQLCVLMVLVDHADTNLISWPAQETIALETGMSRTGVRDTIPKLVDKGLIVVLDAGGPRRSAKYQITLGVRFRAVS